MVPHEYCVYWYSSSWNLFLVKKSMINRAVMMVKSSGLQSMKITLPHYISFLLFSTQDKKRIINCFCTCCIFISSCSFHKITERKKMWSKIAIRRARNILKQNASEKDVGRWEKMLKKISLICLKNWIIIKLFLILMILY